MLHGKVLRSAGRARPDRVDRHDRGGGDAGRRLRPDGRRPARASTPTGHAHQGPAHLAIDRVRFAGEPVAAVAAEDRGDRRGGAARDRRGLRGAAGGRHARRGARAGCAAASTTEPLRAGPVPRARTLPEREGNVCYRYRHRLRRASRRAFAEADDRGRGRLHVPGRLPVRDGDAHASSPEFDARRDHAVGDLPAPVPGARRDRRPVRRAARQRARSSCPTSAAASAASRTRRWSPSRSALARKAGRPVKIVNSVAESMVTTRRHGMRCRMRTAATADGTLLAREVGHRLRHRRLRRQRPARHRDGRRCRARALSLVRGPRRRAVRLHQHRARRARTARSARRTCSGSARCRSTRSPAARASTRSRCGGATCWSPASRCARAASRSTPT